MRNGTHFFGYEDCSGTAICLAFISHFEDTIHDPIRQPNRHGEHIYG